MSARGETGPVRGSSRLGRLAQAAGAVWRTTTFRVALAFAGLFAGFSLLLLGYLYASTVGRLSVEAERGARAEMIELSSVWDRAGVAALNRLVIQRAAQGGDALYVLITPDGDVLSGNIDAVPLDLSQVERPAPGSPPEAFTLVPATFEYGRPTLRGTVETRRAIGALRAGADGFGLFVAHDLGPGFEIAEHVAGVVWTGSAGVLGFALIGGFMAARQAAGRVDELSRTTRAVMSGDLSRRAAVRRKRPQDGDEFDALTGDLNAMLDRTERLVQSARTIGDSVAHDLRSPLTRLRGRLESAAAGAGDEAALRGDIERAVQEIDEIVGTFNAVLRLSRLEAGEGARTQSFDLTALSEEMAELFEPAFEDAGLAFASEIDPGVTLPGDRALIAQAVTNILDNALKYTGEGGVTLRLRALKPAGAEVSVTDTGPGIPEADRQRAVERFVRLDSARSTAGTGIGLSLAAAVAEAHGGRLQLSDGAGPADRPGLRVALILQQSA